MHPLFFLVSRSFFNGVKRSLTSPARAVGTLFFLGSQFWWISRIFAVRSAGSSLPGWDQLPVSIPPTDAIRIAVFAAFAVFSIIGAGMMFANPGWLTPADVDVLFPTPIPARDVMLWQFFRDTLARMLMPLIFTALAWRPAVRTWNAVTEGHIGSDAAGDAIRLVILVALFVSLSRSSLRYALSLLWSGSEEKSARIKNLLSTWSGNLSGVLILGIVGWIFADGGRTWSVDAALRVFDSPVLKIICPGAWAASAIAMLPLGGSWASAAAGLLILGGTSGVAMAVAVKNAQRFYEPASRKAELLSSMRNAQRGGSASYLAEKARNRKFKARGSLLFAKLRLTGDSAIIWKEMVFLYRTSGRMVFLIVLLPAFIIGFPMLVGGADFARNSRVTGIMLSLFDGLLGVMAVTTLAQSGFMEFVRRGDLLRCLPMSPLRICFVEAVGKVIPGVLLSCLFSTLGLIITPAMGDKFLALAVMSVGSGFATSTSMLFAVLLLPDSQDVTQRLFRSLIGSFATLILGFAPMLALGLSSLTKLSPWTTVAIGIPITVGAGIGMLLACARLYETYNPAE